MSWTQPKLNWSGKSGEYFNLNPDYNRIRDNTEYVMKLGNEMYTPFSITNFTYPSLSDIPTISFFNTIVNNIDIVKNNTFTPSGYTAMRRYQANGAIWDYNELNKIEKNIWLLYQMLLGQKEAQRKLSFKLGGGDF